MDHVSLELYLEQIVAAAMSIELRPDKMKRFRDLGETPLVIEETRGAISASGFSEDEAAAVLPLLFKSFLSS